MGFNLRDLNAIDYFREFGLVPRIAFLIGFILLAFGLAQVISFKNPIVALGITLILVSLTVHYLRCVTWRVYHDDYENLHLRSGWVSNLLIGLVFGVFTLFSSLWMFQVAMRDFRILVDSALREHMLKI
jgi:hypothetical protein